MKLPRLELVGELLLIAAGVFILGAIVHGIIGGCLGW